jgi:amino acid transporter
MAVWGVALAAFCLGLPMLGSVTAFEALLSLTVVADIIVTVTPITARCTWGRVHFTPGPFSLGPWAYPLGAISTLWMFATVVFCLPTELPVTAENLNYASIAFIGTCILSLSMFFFPKYGAYKWFTGPACTIDEESTHSLDVIATAAVSYKDVEIESVSKSGRSQGSLLLPIDARLFIKDVEAGCN